MLKKIGNYFLTNKIDENEFRICYKANDNNNKFYFIKEIDIKFKEYIENEIKILKKMNSK